MARVLVGALPEHGHVLPTFPLSAALRARGHEVLYASARPVRKLIESRGFSCANLFSDVTRQGQRVAPTELLPLTALRRHDESTRGDVPGLIQQLAPDVLLVDCLLPELAFVAHGLGVPCLRYSTSLSLRIDELAPITTGIGPDAPQLERQVLQALVRWPTSQRGAPRPHGESPFILDTLARRFGYDPKQIGLDSVFVANLRGIPEVILCASAFDLPRVQAERPVYAAVPAEIDRHEDVPAELLPFIDARRPLVYVSLGSLPERYPDSMPLFSAVLAMLRRRPDLQAVIAAGEHFAKHPSLADPPDNALILGYAPQLWLLARASVFVTHAGLGGVREAIALEVPMLAVPQRFDQPGNAARIVHHGLGLSLREYQAPEPILAATVEARVTTLLHQRDAFLSRLRRMHEAVREEEREGRGVALVERLAAATGSSRSALAPVSAHTPGPRKRPESLRGWIFVGLDGTLLEGPAIAGGITLRSALETAPSVGGDGFTICPELGAALSRGQGGLLARVELSDGLVFEGAHVAGRVLTCLWTLDVTQQLRSFAEWCALLALDPEREALPDSVAYFAAALLRGRELQAGGASTQAFEELHQQTDRAAQWHWYRGFTAAAGALRPCACDAARWARWRAIHSLARRSGGSSLRERAEAYEASRRDIQERVDAELLRRVLASAPGP